MTPRDNVLKNHHNIQLTIYQVEHIVTYSYIINKLALNLHSTKDTVCVTQEFQKSIITFYIQKGYL